VTVATVTGDSNTTMPAPVSIPWQLKAKQRRQEKGSRRWEAGPSPNRKALGKRTAAVIEHVCLLCVVARHREVAANGDATRCHDTLAVREHGKQG